MSRVAECGRNAHPAYLPSLEWVAGGSGDENAFFEAIDFGRFSSLGMRNDFAHAARR